MNSRLKKNFNTNKDFVIQTTPLYNPLGNGESDSEFKNTDCKSYEQMFNKNTMEQAEKRNTKGE